MNPNLLRYIWQYSANNQVVIIILTSLSFPLLYFSLEIPKIIINKALSGSDIPRSLFGFELEITHYLVALCLLLLILIVANGVLKMRINTLKGIIGERLVRRLRFELVERILRFPSAHYQRTSQGELISTITAEAEPLAGYIAESIALPLFQGGTMITILVFMFMQDWVFGLASVALIPIQGYIIPKLQQQVNVLKKERVLKIRKLSERIGETISGAQEIRLQGTQRYSLAEFSHWLGGLFYIRLEIFRKKFFMKFLNNTIGQVTPFLFYLFGGMLVIKGELTIGALVAALSAYKDLTSPWKELLNHYQAHEDSKIKYQQIIDQFSPSGLLPLPDPVSDTPVPGLREPITFRNVYWVSESGEPTLSNINITIEAGSRVAIIGQNAVQRARLAQLFTSLEQPESGSISIGGQSLDAISNHVLRTRIAYQGPDPHFFNGTIQQNIVYGLNHAPPAPEGDNQKQLQILSEAEASGNTSDVFFGDWLDYKLIDVHSPEEFEDHYFSGAATVGSSGVMYQRGLFEVFDPKDYPELAVNVLAARQKIQRRLKKENLQRVVAGFDPDTYNRNATVAENILFGIPSDDNLRLRNLAGHPYLQQSLADLGLLDLAIETGGKAVLRIADRIKNLPIGHSLLNQFDIESDEDIAELSQIATGMVDNQLDNESRTRLLGVFLHLIPELHRFGFIHDIMAAKLLQLRHEFFLNLPSDLRQRITRFDKNAFHPKLNIIDNLLFGRVVAKEPAAEKRIGKIVEETLDEMGFKRDIMMLLAQSQVGIRGGRLASTAKHNIAVARMIIKKPHIMIFHDALAPFDSIVKRTLRSNIREMLPESTLIWIDREIDNLMEFDRVFRFTQDGSLEDVTVAKAKPIAMSSDNLSIIGHSPIFGKLSATQQQLLSENCYRASAEAGEFIYHSGNPSNNAYIIIQGEVHTLEDPSKQDEIRGKPTAGETLGIVEIMAQRNRILSAKAATPVEMLRIDGATIQEIIENDVAVVQIMLRALTEQWAPTAS